MKNQIQNQKSEEIKKIADELIAKGTRSEDAIDEATEMYEKQQKGLVVNQAGASNNLPIKYVKTDEEDAAEILSENINFVCGWKTQKVARGKVKASLVVYGSFNGRRIPMIKQNKTINDATADKIEDAIKMLRHKVDSSISKVENGNSMTESMEQLNKFFDEVSKDEE